MLEGSMYAVVAARSYVMDRRLSCHTMDHLPRLVFRLGRVSYVRCSPDFGPQGLVFGICRWRTAAMKTETHG